MKISAVENLHCNAGWRNLSFLKVTTDDGIIGYSEYNQSPAYGSSGVATVIDALAPTVIGSNPLDHERLFSTLYGTTFPASGGINAQAIAAIENALLDIKGKALGVPVYRLLGGAMRDRLRVDWSHCGTYRMHESTARFLGKPTLKSLDDVRALGEEVKKQGFTALKCNMNVFDEQPHGYGWRRSFPDRNAEKVLIRAVYAQVEAFNEGTGGDVDILLDTVFTLTPESHIRMIRELTPLGLFWYELDIYNPDALAYIRQRTDTPIASCEKLYGIRDFRPYFQMQAMDVAIIDVPRNGIWQSYKIATIAHAHDVNVAPHNFYGHLSNMMSAHFCAAVPNFRIMEIDIEDVPWMDDLVTHPPEIVDGHMLVPDRPGWGCDVDEKAMKAHPPQQF